MRATVLAAVVMLCSVPWMAKGEEAAPAPPTPASLEPSPVPAPPAGAPAAPLAAADRPSTGFTFGLRAAWAKPLGEVAGEVSSDNAQPLDKEFQGSFPFTVEAGYRFANGLTAGGYFGYGPADLQGTALNGGCADFGTSCDSGRMRRLGVQLTYHLLRVRPFTPWFGAGTGYEWASFDVKDAFDSGSVTYKGWEIVNLQLGGDYAVSPRFFLGPFVSMSYGRYGEVEAEADGMQASFELAEKKIHSWLQLGVRARFDP